MFRLTKRFRDSVRTRFRDDQGIAMVFVALLLIMLFGMVAFAIDTGALYQERRELQNGADAAVLAIAEDCARGTVACDTATVTATAEAYADGNAGDGRAEVPILILDTTAQSIEVVTETETSDGGTIFRPFFAQVIGFTGTEVGARAKAIWGPAAAGDLPLTISECEWQRAKERILASVNPQTGQLYEKPWYPNLGSPEAEASYEDWVNAYGEIRSPDNPAWETWTTGEAIPDGHPGVGMEIIFHTSNPDVNNCAAQAGQDIVEDIDGDTRLPGGFGWLEDEGGCYAKAFNGQWFQGEPGNGVPCTKVEIDDLLGTTVTIPVFYDVQPPAGGNVRSYKMRATMGFFITGYRFPGNSDNLADGPACTGPTTCLIGYPTDVIDTSGPIDPGGELRGALVVKLTG